MDYDPFAGLDMQALLAQMQPNEEERRRAKRDGLMNAGFAMLMNPYRGQEAQAFGAAGMAGMGMYRQSLDDQAKMRQQALMQAAALQKMGKEAAFQDRRMAMFNEMNGGAPQGAPAPSGAPHGNAPGMPQPTQAAPAQGNPQASSLLAEAQRLGVVRPVQMALMSDSDPFGKAATIIAEASRQRTAVSPGQTVLGPDGQPVYSAPNLDKGMTMGPNGVQPMPGYPQTVAAIAGATQDAQEAAKYRYQPVPSGTVDAQGRPVQGLMPQVYGTPGGGQPAPAIPPAAPGDRVTINLKDAPREEALALLQSLTGQTPAAPAGGVLVGPDPIVQEQRKAAVETGARAEQDTNKTVLDGLTKGATIAQNAVNGIATVHEARKALDSGNVITGAGADFRLNFARATGLAGNASDKEKAAATQTYAATMARQVLNIIGNLGAGSGISDADREYAAKIEGGQITLEEGAMRRLLDISEKAMRAAITQQNDRVGKAPEALRKAGVSDYFTVTMPPDYVKPKALPRLAPAVAGNLTAQKALADALAAGDEAAIARLRQKGYLQ